MKWLIKIKFIKNCSKYNISSFNNDLAAMKDKCTFSIVHFFFTFFSLHVILRLFHLRLQPFVFSFGNTG